MHSTSSLYCCPEDLQPVMLNIFPYEHPSQLLKPKPNFTNLSWNKSARPNVSTINTMSNHKSNNQVKSELLFRLIVCLTSWVWVSTWTKGEWAELVSRRHWGITTSSQDTSKHQTINTHNVRQTVPWVLSDVGLDSVSDTGGRSGRTEGGLQIMGSFQVYNMWHYSQQDLEETKQAGASSDKEKRKAATS